MALQKSKIVPIPQDENCRLDSQTVETSMQPGNDYMNIKVHDNARMPVMDYTWTLQGIHIAAAIELRDQLNEQIKQYAQRK